MTRVTYGRGLMTQLAAINRLPAFSRTSTRTSGTGSEKFAEISKEEATAFRLVYSARKKLALRTDECGSLFSRSKWMTPHGMAGVDATGKMGAGGEFAKQATQWATMTAYDAVPAWPANHYHGLQKQLQQLAWSTPGAMCGGTVSRGNERVDELLLAGQAAEVSQNWPTAKASDGSKQSGPGKFSNDTLTTAVKLWATPNIPNRGPETAESKAGRPKAGGIDLQTQSLQWSTPQAERVTWRQDTPLTDGGGNRTLGLDISNWGTPSANDFKGSAQPGQHRGQLSEHAECLFPTSLPPETTPPSGSQSSPPTPISPPPSPKRKLNPAFVEWLMGFPIGFSETLSRNGIIGCGPAEMQSYLSRQRSLLSVYLLNICGE